MTLAAGAATVAHGACVSSSDASSRHQTPDSLAPPVVDSPSAAGALLDEPRYIWRPKGKRDVGPPLRLSMRDIEVFAAVRRILGGRLVNVRRI